MRDSSGAVLPGATVEAVGPVGTVTAVSDDQGAFRFPRLPSGKYKLSAELSGFAKRESEVDLTVGSTSRVDFGLTVSGIAEAVQVSSSPAIDLTSPATATNITRERIELLPSGRDFADVVGQAAGAANERAAGGITIDGSSGSENRYVIDGVDTTDPQDGMSAVPLLKEFTEEIQVKSAGYPAEFGGSTGGVVNVITRSGTNDYRGSLLADFQNRSWGGSERPLLRQSLTVDDFEYLSPPKDKQTRVDPGVALGGPILRDRLWFFGSYQPGIRNTERAVQFTNGVSNTFEEDLRVNYGTFNISGNASSKLLFRGGGNFAPATTEGTLPGQDGRTSLTRREDWVRGIDRQRHTFYGSADYVPMPQLVISGRIGRFLTDEESTGVTFPDIIHGFSGDSTPEGIAALPAEFRRQVGFSSDVLVTNATQKDKYTRDSYKIDATYYMSKFGEHQIKGGFQTEKLANDAQTGYNADRILYYAGRAWESTDGRTVRGQFGYFRLLNISTVGKVSSRNDSLFIQDSWKVTPRLTLDIGLRTEHERIPNFGTAGVSTPIEFGYGDKLAPRLGFAFDPLGNQRWKIYGSYGKYFDIMKYEMPRGSFGGEKWVDYIFAWDSANWPSNSVGTCHTGSNTIAERPACPAGRLEDISDRRFNAATDLESSVEPDLKPMQTDEYQIGVSRELARNIVVGARYVRKNLVRTIEDVGVVRPQIGEQFYIANPGEGITLSLQDPGVPAFPKAKREYDGLELTVQRRFSDRWAVHASYTLSRLYGNYSGLASSDEIDVDGDGRTAPNVNRFFDHIENTFDRNGDLVFGRLGTDRPHFFKGQLIYQFKWDMTVGVNQLLGSGFPISEEAQIGQQVPFFPFGRGNLGRTDALMQTDLRLMQSFKLSRYTLQLEATILNLFDRDAVAHVFNGKTIGVLPLTTDEFFAGGWDYNALANDPDVVDHRFGQADVFQGPREIRLGVRFRF